MEVTLYTLPTCGMCKLLKEQLNRKKIVFKEVQDLNILEKKKIIHVPTLEINGSLMNFKQALKWIEEVTND